MPQSAGLEGQGVDRREDGGDRDRDREGPVEPAGDPGHDDGRDKDRQQHQGRGDDGAGDLEHGLGGGLLGPETLFVDDPHGVFDDDDGVVDDDPDDQDQTEHGQPVDRQPEGEHDREGAEQRHRDGDGRHQGGAEVLEEEIDGENHQQDGDDEGGHHLLERLEDVLGGVVEDAVFEALGEVGAEALHLGLDPLGHLEGVGPRRGIDGDGDGRCAVELGVPHVALGAELDAGDITDANQLARFAAS